MNERTAEGTIKRLEKLERLKVEVEDFLNKALFIIGADKIRDLLKELNEEV